MGQETRREIIEPDATQGKKDISSGNPVTRREAGSPVVRVRKGGSREASIDSTTRHPDKIVTLRKPSREDAPLASTEAQYDKTSSQRPFAEYHGFLKALEDGRPDNMSHISTELYRGDLSLDTELAGVPDEGLVVDVGCCGGVGTEGLAQCYTDKRFIGVTPNLISHKTGNGIRELSIPILQGRAEDLTSVLGSHGFGQADVLLMRNVMELLCMGQEVCNAQGILPAAMQQAHDVLTPGGRLLIYDQFGTGQRGRDFYETYTNLGRQMGFEVAQLPCAPTRNRKGQASEYLRMTKLS